MEYAIWGAQVLLALLFGAGGTAQLVTPQPFAEKLFLTFGSVRLLGVGALAAAVAVVGPQVLGMSALATSGAAVFMSGLCFWLAVRLTKQQWPRYATAMLFVMVVAVFVAVFRLPFWAS